MPAKLIPTRYATPERLVVTVECDECLIVLNSGHHYGPDYTHLAVRLADLHNEEMGHRTLVAADLPVVKVERFS